MKTLPKYGSVGDIAQLTPATGTCHGTPAVATPIWTQHREMKTAHMEKNISDQCRP